MSLCQIKETETPVKVNAMRAYLHFLTAVLGPRNTLQVLWGNEDPQMLGNQSPVLAQLSQKWKPHQRGTAVHRTSYTCSSVV